MWEYKSPTRFSKRASRDPKTRNDIDQHLLPLFFRELVHIAFRGNTRK